MIKTNRAHSYHEAGSFEDEIFVALFRKGANDYIENDLLGVLPHTDKSRIPSFSEISDKKIKRIINQAIHKEKTVRMIKRMPRFIAIILMALAVCTITVMSVDALRVPFLNLFVNTKQKITTIEVNEVHTNDDNRFADMFGYIPDGYELKSEDQHENTTSLIFSNDNGESIFIDIFNNEHCTGVDTENAEYSKIMINACQGFYSIKNGTTTLVFIKDNFTYLILGSIDLEKTIKIAENIK